MRAERGQALTNMTFPDRKASIEEGAQSGDAIILPGKDEQRWCIGASVNRRTFLRRHPETGALGRAVFCDMDGESGRQVAGEIDLSAIAQRFARSQNPGAKFG